ncbi:SMP-30/gluconolactonase/LRE family protein [Haliangium sp.]|uniref:SMP-30/gluconolactonase/LRE family protein n=1 Tax=Haliangium sp. TaxID=2663208 RepID=UPI003D0EFE35
MPPAHQTPSSRPRPRRLRAMLLRVAVVVAVLVVVLAVTLRVRYGGGAPYPDLSTAPLLPDSALEVAATVDEPIGNVAVSADGRLFFTIHPESRPEGAKLLEWVDGQAVPFPSAEAQERFDTVLGLAIDGQGRLWTIDHGNHGLADARLLAIDIATRELVHDHVFSSEIAELGSFLQDLQVSPDGQTVYIADVSFWRKNPGLVVYDVAAGSARRVLDSHPSVSPQDWIIRNPTKDMVFFGGLVALKAGVDGIALSRDQEWLFYCTMNHDTLYRVRTADLRDPALSPDELGERVEAVGKKPLCDGLSSDVEGNVLITDVEHGGVARMAPDGALTTLVASERIRWADALSYGPGGWLYIADSAIPDQMLQSKDHIRARAPYYIYRVRPGIDGVPGQ